MTTRARPFALAALIVVGGGAACTAPVVTVEVLPPRTSVTCAAPGVGDPALGRGLLDAAATETVHGGYLVDVRVVSTGANARVDGVDVRLSRDGKEVALFENVPTGDVFLVGEDDDVRKAVVENVELVPRQIAESLAEDDSITDLDFATLVIEIAPRVLDAEITPASSSFALDVCNGCLVTEPDTEECPGGARKNSVCREGQDVELYSCAPVVGGAP